MGVCSRLAICMAIAYKADELYSVNMQKCCLSSVPKITKTHGHSPLSNIVFNSGQSPDMHAAVSLVNLHIPAQTLSPSQSTSLVHYVLHLHVTC